MWPEARRMAEVLQKERGFCNEWFLVDKEKGGKRVIVFNPNKERFVLLESSRGEFQNSPVGESINHPALDNGIF